MSLRFPFLIKHTTATSGNATYVMQPGAAPAGYRTLANAAAAGDLSDGDSVGYICRDSTVVGGINLLEVGVGVYSAAGNSVTRAQVFQPNATIVTWGSGMRDFLVIDNPLLYAVLANQGSDYNPALFIANLGLTVAATTPVGTAAGDLIVLDGSGHLPAVDARNLLNVPQFPSGTKMLFYQPAVPANWTAITVLDDVLVGICNNSGTGGGGPYAGGTMSAGSWDVTTGLSIASHALLGTEIPTVANGAAGSAVNVIPSSAVIAGLGHNHGFGTNPLTWRPPVAHTTLGIKN